MAKKKKKTAAKRVSGSKSILNVNSPIVIGGSILLGFLAAKPVNEGIDKLTGGNVDGKIVAAVQGGVGTALILMRKKMGKGMALPATIVGGIALGSGAKRAMTEFGIGGLGGYQQVPGVAGYQQVPAVGNGYGGSGMGYPRTYVRETVGSGLMDRAA